MQFKNSPSAFGAVTKTFHWLMALLVVTLICVGLYFTSMPNTPDVFPLKIKLVSLHKSVGILVLTLVTLRIVWHIYTRTPDFVGGMKPWERMAARASHLFLYFAMITMPLSGWIFSSAAGRPVSFFKLFTLPDLVGKNHAVKEALETYHVTLAWVLIAVIALHAAAALKHHFISKDSTLRRMLPFCKNT